MITTLSVGAKQPPGSIFSAGKKANIVGLKINERKIKYIIASGNDRMIRDVGQSVAFGFQVQQN
jgi:hypothetical protein